MFSFRANFRSLRAPLTLPLACMYVHEFEILVTPKSWKQSNDVVLLIYALNYQSSGVFLLCHACLLVVDGSYQVAIVVISSAKIVTFSELTAVHPVSFTGS